MKIRYKDTNSNIYRFNADFICSPKEREEYLALRKKKGDLLYQKNIAKQQSKERVVEIDAQLSLVFDRMKEIQEKAQKILAQEIQQRNILTQSHRDDVGIGRGQDSAVFAFKNNKNYVYKEAHNSNESSLLYLQNKYRLLKKYLGNVIPDSAFVFWEAKPFGDNAIVWLPVKLITIQRKIHWKTFKEMTEEEKNNPKMLEKLEEAHAKYNFLKIFLRKVIRTLDLPDKTMDVRLDLWILSDKDTFPEDAKFIRSIRSPNIMWDGENISFIDFGLDIWNEDKQKIFDYMMQDEVYEKWLMHSEWLNPATKIDLKKQ